MRGLEFGIAHPFSVTMHYLQAVVCMIARHDSGSPSGRARRDVVRIECDRPNVELIMRKAGGA